MVKRLIQVVGVLVLLWGLVACGSPSSTPSSPDAEATSATPMAGSTSAATRPAPSPAATATSGSSVQPTLTPRESGTGPQPTPTRPWQVPEVMTEDWVTGGSEAGLILVEYSDFQ